MAAEKIPGMTAMKPAGKWFQEYGCKKKDMAAEKNPGMTAMKSAGKWFQEYSCKKKRHGCRKKSRDDCDEICREMVSGIQLQKKKDMAAEKNPGMTAMK